MSWLDEVCRQERTAAAERAAKTPIEALLEAARALPPARGFVGALRGSQATASAAEDPRQHSGLPAVIAEIKFASPSQGPIRKDRDVEKIARGYAKAGAAALSVLIDGPRFGGDPKFLARAAAVTELPVLAKGFFIDPYQVVEARLQGADAVLLIARCLSTVQLVELGAAARAAGLATLVEVRDTDDRDKIVGLPLDAIGVNNRDLESLALDREAFLRLADRLPEGPARVAESGFTAREDLERAAIAGYDAVLIGTHLMRRSDPGEALAELLAAPPDAPARKGVRGAADQDLRSDAS